MPEQVSLVHAGKSTSGPQAGLWCSCLSLHISSTQVAKHIGVDNRLHLARYRSGPGEAWHLALGGFQVAGQPQLCEMQVSGCACSCRCGACGLRCLAATEADMATWGAALHLLAILCSRAVSIRAGCTEHWPSCSQRAVLQTCTIFTGHPDGQGRSKGSMINLW